jgi:predicted ATPase
LSRVEISAAQSLGEQLLGVAERAQDPALLLQAHHALGVNYMAAGDWASAQLHLERSIALYDPQQHRPHALLYGGHDPCVCCLGYAALCLWISGYPDQALRRSREGLALAIEMSDPSTLAHARFQSGIFHQFRRDILATQYQSEQILGLAAEHGLVVYQAAGSVLLGWALAQQGQGEEGLAQIRQGLDASARIPQNWRVHFRAMLAETYGKAGKVEEGLTALAEALREVEESGFGFYEPEPHRLQGELLLARGPENSANAESCFRQAIAIARRQQAKSLELRAVTSLSRLLQKQDKQAEARPMLAEIYGWFTEGFDTVDLQEAKALLQVIS